MVKTFAPAMAASAIAACAERPRLRDGHAEAARLERAGGVLPLVFSPDVPQPEMRGEPAQRQQRRAPLAQRHRRLVFVERRQLAEAVHPRRAGLQRILRHARLHARQVVTHREHLSALLTDAEHALGVVTVAADRALDVADEAHSAVECISFRTVIGRRARCSVRSWPTSVRTLTASPPSDHNGHMTKVGVARLKAQLSRYLEMAKRGQEVVVTERGRPIVKLVALGGADHADSRLERLIRAGVVIPGSGRLRASLRKPPRGPRVGDGVLKALLEEREESR